MNCVYFGIEALHISDDPPDDDDSDGKYEPKLEPDAFDRPKKELAAQLPEVECEQADKYTRYVTQGIQIFTELYLLADRLQDLKTANLVIDGTINFIYETGVNPSNSEVALAYESTVHGNPIRKMMRDKFVYESRSDCYMEAFAKEWNSDFTRDVMVEFMRFKDCGYQAAIDVIWDTKGELVDACRYHQHNEKHPRCVPKPEEGYNSSPDQNTATEDAE